MAGLAVDDAQGMATGREIKIHWFNDGMLLVEEVNGHQIAHGRSRLIHKAAGLAEEDILGILANLGNFRLADLPLKKQAVDNGSDEHLKGSGRTQAGAGQHRALAVGIKARHPAAQLCKAGADAPHQGGGRIDFLLLGHQAVQRHGAQRIALGENAHGLGPVDPDCSLGIQVYGCRQNPAPLVVRMVAANLCAAGCREIALRLSAESLSKALVQNFLLCLCKMQRL